MNIPADILRLEREAIELAARVAAMERRKATDEQTNASLWYNPFWSKTSPVVTTNCHITGQVKGCANTGVAGCTVTVRDASNIAVYATGITDLNGNYGLDAAIPADNTSARISVDPGGPYASRFAPFGPVLVTLRTLPIGTPLGVQVLNAASGYHCSGIVYFPLASTLQMTDTVIGNTTLTWGTGGPSQWGGTVNYNYPGCSMFGCTAIASCPVTFTMVGGSNNLRGYARSAGGSCPNNAGGTTNVAGRDVTLTLTSTSPFRASGTITVQSDSLYCTNVPFTRTLTE